MQDLNLRPLGPKPSALPNCANYRHILLGITILNYYLNKQRMGWLTGLEPATAGITIRSSTN
jgi:hypothetical protein